MASLSPKQLRKDSRKQQKMQYNTGNLLAMGIDPATIAETTGAASLDTDQEFQAVIDAYNRKKAAGAAPQGMKRFQDTEYQWDPNEFLPGVQEQSSAIYDPRQQQLEALRKLQESKYEEQRARTKEEYAQRMQAEEEAINRRGAWFSGGAIRNEQDIRNEQMRLLNQQDLQNQASRGELLAQQGALGYEQSQFEKNALFDSEASAYNRFTDQRAFDYMYESNERQYATQALMGAIDSFNLRNNFGLNVGQFKLAQDQFKEDARRWDEEFAWNKFMYKNMQE